MNKASLFSRFDLINTHGSRLERFLSLEGRLDAEEHIFWPLRNIGYIVLNFHPSDPEKHSDRGIPHSILIGKENSDLTDYVNDFLGITGRLGLEYEHMGYFTPITNIKNIEEIYKTKLR